MYPIGYILDNFSGSNTSLGTFTNYICFLLQLETHNSDFEVLILKDENGDADKKYKQFLKQITPPNFENITCMSKYIIIDKSGDVLMITNWKDRQGTH